MEDIFNRKTDKPNVEAFIFIDDCRHGDSQLVRKVLTSAMVALEETVQRRFIVPQRIRWSLGPLEWSLEFDFRHLGLDDVKWPYIHLNLPSLHPSIDDSWVILKLLWELTAFPSFSDITVFVTENQAVDFVRLFFENDESKFLTESQLSRFFPKYFFRRGKLCEVPTEITTFEHFQNLLRINSLEKFKVQEALKEQLLNHIKALPSLGYSQEFTTTRNAITTYIESVEVPVIVPAKISFLLEAYPELISVALGCLDQRKLNNNESGTRVSEEGKRLLNDWLVQQYNYVEVSDYKWDILEEKKTMVVMPVAINRRTLTSIRHKRNVALPIHYMSRHWNAPQWNYKSNPPSFEGFDFEDFQITADLKTKADYREAQRLGALIVLGIRNLIETQQGFLLCHNSQAEEPISKLGEYLCGNDPKILSSFLDIDVLRQKLSLVDENWRNEVEKVAFKRIHSIAISEALQQTRNFDFKNQQESICHNARILTKDSRFEIAIRLFEIFWDVRKSVFPRIRNPSNNHVFSGARYPVLLETTPAMGEASPEEIGSWLYFADFSDLPDARNTFDKHNLERQLEEESNIFEGIEFDGTLEEENKRLYEELFHKKRLSEEEFLPPSDSEENIKAKEALVDEIVKLLESNDSNKKSQIRSLCHQLKEMDGDAGAVAKMLVQELLSQDSEDDGSGDEEGRVAAEEFHKAISDALEEELTATLKDCKPSEIFGTVGDNDELDEALLLENRTCDTLGPASTLKQALGIKKR